jgi:Trk K+ transport system NAD-binding subunit
MYKLYLFLGILLLSFSATAQLDNITGVTLTFTPTAGTAVTATATDSGNGLTVDGGITLLESADYALTVAVESAGTDITSQIMAGADDHQVFFSPTGSILSGDVTATDTDGNGLPLGLSSDLTTECTEDDNVTGMLRAVLADLTNIKTAASTIDDGTALFDLTWMITVEEDVNAPPCENEEEIITDVVLTFTPVDGGTPITATAQDPDGEGPLDLEIVNDIELVESTEYTMTMTLTNSVEGEDITEEIMEEDDEHMFFFAFTDEVFTSPAGDGNVDNRPDPVNYNDFDENNLPVGLFTNWETECGQEVATGTFRVILKHQPGIKSATTTVDDGGTDVDLTWTVNVSEDPNAPPCENEEEVITDVVLTFTPVDGGTPITATAQDPDGEGPLDLEIVNDIELVESTEYTMTMTLTNSVEGEDITEEIMEEDDEHMFFFAFTDEVFTSPAGDGNVDNRPDPVNYNDFDENNLPVGLFTNWETECGQEVATGTFRVILKHQPGIKSATTTVDDGGTDVDLTWTVNVSEDPNAPPCENEEEIITDVVLTFTPVDGGTPITATAQDPDGEGPLDLEIINDIELVESTEYTMTMTLTNSVEGEDITEEIMEEDDEHMFFFAFTDEVFTSPAGDGNVDNRPDPVNYNDFDENNLPVGLSTNWETECGEEVTTGTFRVILKHQPGIKSATTTVDDGGTDVDLTWTVNVSEDPNAPPCENEEEVITDVVLTWSPVGGGDTIRARAQDPDGEGPLDLAILDGINLTENTEYTLTLELTNSIEGEDITEEIMEEDDEHMFFFAFTEDIFTNPLGDGNVDNRPDPVAYNDFDENGLPVGLSTSWTTPANMGFGGTFRLVLKHQPDIKSATSTVNDGGTDVDLTFDLNTTTSISGPQGALNSQLTLVPNPTYNQLNWRLSGQRTGDPVEVRIISVAGQVLQTYRSPTPRIDVSQLPAGSYLFHVQTERASGVKRFIKVD